MHTTTDSSTTFLNVRRIDLKIPGISQNDAESIMDQIIPIDRHASMINKEVFGQGLFGSIESEWIFTFSYVYEQQLKEVKKLYFKLKLQHTNVRYYY